MFHGADRSGCKRSSRYAGTGRTVKPQAEDSLRRTEKEGGSWQGNHPQTQTFLFDEPLNGLDEKVQVQIRTEIEKLHERYGTTILYAAHDKDEAKKFDAENNRILPF